jgi:predicted transcriptional regulator of viral defense system
MVDTLQFSFLPPELDFLAVTRLTGETGNVRDKVSRLMKSGKIQGVVPGIYTSAPEFRKRPLSLEILANKIYGPSYVSFEFVLARAGLIPEAVYGVTSATAKRNRDFDTHLGRFSYRHLPPEVYCFGWISEVLNDGSSYLIATPEKALLDLLYRAGAVRSVKSLKARLFEDFRVDHDALRSLDMERLMSYALKMPGDTFKIHLRRLLKKDS